MRERWRRCPRLECLEGRLLLSPATGALSHPAKPALSGRDSKTPKVEVSDAALGGTLDGTFFAHGGKAPTIYSLFASGRLSPVGGSLLVGGFEASASRAGARAVGNLLLTLKSTSGHINLHLTATPSSSAAGQPAFTYVITQGSGGARDLHGSGIVVISLHSIDTNLQGKPVSNPGFYGDATLAFEPNAGS